MMKMTRLRVLVHSPVLDQTLGAVASCAILSLREVFHLIGEAEAAEGVETQGVVGTGRAKMVGQR